MYKREILVGVSSAGLVTVICAVMLFFLNGRVEWVPRGISVDWPVEGFRLPAESWVEEVMGDNPVREYRVKSKLPAEEFFTELNSIMDELGYIKPRNVLSVPKKTTSITYVSDWDNQIHVMFRRAVPCSCMKTSWVKHNPADEYIYCFCFTVVE